jgi:phosphate-selective porin OprO/OprP
MIKQFRKSTISTLVASALGTLALTGTAIASESDLQRRVDAMQKDLDALKAQAAKAAAAPVASAVTGATRYEDGYLVWGSGDGKYELKLDGRVQLDVGPVNSKLNGGVVKSDSKFRRVRLAFKGKFDRDWNGELDLDFANNELDIKDMWLAYTGFEGVGIKVGHFKPHFSIDQVTSSRVATYMESSIATELFAPSRRIGLAADYVNDWVFVGGGVFGDKINTAGEARDNPSMNAQSETFGYSMRTAVRPLWRADPNKAFHIGLNVLYNRPRSNVAPDDDRLKFASVVENELTQVEFIDTKQIQGVRGALTTGLEVAYKHGPHILSGEYLKTKVKLKGVMGNMHPTVAAVWPSVQAPSFDTYYVAYSYFISGDRRYDAQSAEFASVTGRNALELTARYSVADMNDSGGYTRNRTSAYRDTSRGVFGGKANIATLGLNWYPNPHVKLMVNYMDIKLDKDADADAGGFELANATVVPIVGNDRIKVLGLRAQFVF